MTKEEILTCKAFLLDLDGTVYLDEKPIGNMIETLKTLRRMGKRIVYVTNSSSRSEEEYEARLKEIGVWGTGDVVFTSGTVAKEVLKTRFAGKRVYLLATEEIKRSFAVEGITLVEEGADVAVLSYDMTATFEKLKKFNAHLRKGAYYVATHTDLVCPTRDVPQPDVGSFIALFEASSGRKPDLITGKPGKPLADAVCAKLGLLPEEMCMVGDRMYTDIRFGAQNGMKTIAVLTGEITLENIHLWDDRVDLILPDFNDILA